MNRVFVTGDVHFNYDIAKLVDFADGEGSRLTKDDYVIILGDFGVIWTREECDKELELLEWYNKLPWTTLFLDGNHENFDRLKDYNAYPVKLMWGGLVSKISKSVYHLLRSQVFNFNNKSFLVLGGADSVDKPFRVEGHTWWEDEVVSKEDIEIALCNAGNKQIDYVLTHSAPTQFVEDLYITKMLPSSNRFLGESEKRLQILESKINYKQWYFGHYHCDFKKDKYEAFFNNIREIDFSN